MKKMRSFCLNIILEVEIKFKPFLKKVKYYVYYTFLMIIAFLLIDSTKLSSQISILKENKDGNWFIYKDDDPVSNNYVRIKRHDISDSLTVDILKINKLEQINLNSKTILGANIFQEEYSHLLYGKFSKGQYFSCSELFNLSNNYSFRVFKFDDLGLKASNYKSNVNVDFEIVSGTYTPSANRVETTEHDIYLTPANVNTQISGIFNLGKYLNIKKFKFFEFQDFKLGHHLTKVYNNKIFLIYINQFLDSSQRHSTIFLADTSLNISKSVRIKNFNHPNIDFLEDGKLLLTGYNTDLKKASYIFVDSELNYLSEMSFVNESPEDSSTFHALDKMYSNVNINGDLFIKIPYKRIQILIKYDKNLNIIWKKVFPFSVRLWVDNIGGAYFSRRVGGDTEVYTIDANGITNPPLDDYCGEPLIKSDYYKDKILPFTEYKVLEDAQLWEESSEFYPSIDTEIQIDTAFFIVDHPEPDFLEDTYCLYNCDSIVAQDIGIIDSGYYNAPGQINDNIWCPQDTGMIDVTRYITYYGGCIDSITKTVEVYNTPFLATSDTRLVCIPGEGTELKAMTDSASILTWENGSSDTLFIATLPGIYKVTASNEHCSITSDILVELISDQYPQWPDILAESTIEHCEGDEVILNVRDGFPGSLQWQDGTNAPSFTVENSGYVFVDGSLQGCTTRDSVLIQFKDCRQSAVYIPNVFSPNEDGVNDYFLPNYLNADILELSIYDRWGSQMYHRAPFDGLGWDGRFNNQEMMPGVYVWLLRYRDNLSGREEMRKGSVQLVR